MRIRSRTLPTLVCLLLLAGCRQEEEDRTAYQELNIAADTAAGYEEGEIPAPVVPVQGGPDSALATVPGPLTAAGNFIPAVEGVQQAGSIVVSEVGAGTRVQSPLTGFEPGLEVRAAFVEGGCDSPGDVVPGFDPVLRMDGTGAVTLVEQIPVATRSLLDGEHAARLTIAAAATRQVTLACAPLPATRN